MIPNWSVEESAEFFLKRRHWERAEWFPIGTFKKNQGRRGSCNYYAKVMVMERLIKLNYLYDIKLSPEYGYANNVDGNDMGSLLSESMRDFAKLGAPPFEQHHYEKIRKRDFSAEDMKNALRFTGVQWVRITSWEMLIAAVAIGYPCVIAIHAGRNFMDIKRDGFCGVDTGDGNHAICVDRLKIPASGDLKKTGLENPGSWGINVHDDGIAFIKEEHTTRTMKFHPFWAGVTMRLDPEIRTDFNLKIAA